MLDRHFETVDSRVLSTQVVLEDPAPLLRHAASTSAAKMSEELGAGMMARLETAAADIIRRDGVLRIADPSGDKLNPAIPTL